MGAVMIKIERGKEDLMVRFLYNPIKNPLIALKEVKDDLKVVFTNLFSNMEEYGKLGLGTGELGESTSLNIKRTWREMHERKNRTN